jgi:hypothetical protein
MSIDFRCDNTNQSRIRTSEMMSSPSPLLFCHSSSASTIPSLSSKKSLSESSHQKSTVYFVRTDIIRVFCHGGYRRSTVLFRRKVHMVSVLHQIFTVVNMKTHNTLHIKKIQVLYAKIVDVVLSSGISHCVVHRKLTYASEEHTTLVSCLAYYWTLKMEAMCCSKMSIDFSVECVAL